MSLWGEQNDSGFGLRRSQLNPTLFAVERLICKDGKAEFLSKKIQRALLVANWQAD